MTPMLCCAYAPHWSVSEGRWTSSQSTSLKLEATYSWDLAPGRKRFVPRGLTLRPESVSAVTTGGLQSSDAAAHRWLRLSACDVDALEQLQGAWFAFARHWRFDGPVASAVCGTWLKRSCAPSWTLGALEKQYVCPGFEVEVDELVQAEQSEHFGCRCLAVPELRQPLCKYFPADARELERQVDECFADPTWGPGGRMLAQAEAAFLVPHGGFCNSGFVAARAFAQLPPAECAVVIGNNHACYPPACVPRCGYAVPTGMLPLCARSLEALELPIDERAHQQEHSIENQVLQGGCVRAFWLAFCFACGARLAHCPLQVPFLLARGVQRLVPVLVGHVGDAEARALGARVAGLVRACAVLVGTTDFSHEGPAYGTGKTGETMAQARGKTRVATRQAQWWERQVS